MGLKEQCPDCCTTWENCLCGMPEHELLGLEHGEYVDQLSDEELADIFS